MTRAKRKAAASNLPAQSRQPGRELEQWSTVIAALLDVPAPRSHEHGVKEREEDDNGSPRIGPRRPVH